MKETSNYIVTWFYKESAEEASFYPQMGEKGDSSLVHSIYMQIQVPFFRTFQRYNPLTKLIFFTNLQKTSLPGFLRNLFDTLQVEVVTLPYTCRPPRNWYGAWQNQFYLYDILHYMEARLKADDVMLVTDADCLCRASLDPLFTKARTEGSALYEFITDRNARINGITLPEMESLYEAYYKEKPRRPLTYYGGEFVCLRGDTVRHINQAYPDLWKFNLQRSEDNLPKLNEEAHVLSLLAERLQIRNDIANGYVKRMWTSPLFNNVVPGDERLAVWHLPYEKKRGLYHLYKYLEKRNALEDEDHFWKKAKELTGIPHISVRKRIRDRITTLIIKLKNRQS